MAAPGTVHLPIIAATSPTRAEAMRTCFLRAALSRAAGLSNTVLGNPKAWLGTAYHEVLERIPSVDLAVEPAAAAIDRLWNQAIATQHQRMLAHPLDRRFGLPPTWPGYYVTRASVELRARALTGAVSRTGTPGTPGSEPVAREEEFKACGGKLLGRPDVIQGEDVVDYKSGAVVEYDEATQSDVVKAAYVRQLRLYGYLVQQRSGAWPRRGILFPAVGEGVEVALTPSECEDEARQAVALLDEYNARVRSGAPPPTFASAMPANCKWCSYKLVCASFWQSAAADWSGKLDGAAVEGTVIEAPQPVQGGAALAFSLDVEAGSESSRRARVSPLNPNVHDSVNGLRVGDRVRVIGLRIRSDGVLVPSPRTVIRAVSEIPVVVAAQCSQREK